ncbi:MAG TPA: Hsp20/alpha crystallin family protein [Desulfobulbus sp.]|nr:Hsp20/alpha crystallin family protein [Desulfobulbus sp.]
MDHFSKKIFQELEEMQQQTGRMLRNMSLARMVPMGDRLWQPPVDIYEAASEIYIYFDLAGVDRSAFEVLVGEHQVRVSGRRQLPAQGSIACVHQLEIELGRFERTVSLPSVVDVAGANSSYTDGILMITLPKRQKKVRVRIQVREGE